MAIISPIIKTNKQKIFEGGSKDVFQIIDDESAIIIFFKDTIRDSAAIHNISGKGVINNKISSFMMEKLDIIGLQNHFIEKTNMREQLVQVLDIIPVQVRVSNVAVDSYVSSFGVQEGYLFDNPMIEFRVKNRNSGYPSINESQMVGFNWLTYTEVKEIKKLARRVNDFLCGYFSAIGIRLVVCNLEFGRVFNGEEFIFMLADEITPESCMLWDLHNNHKYDVESILKSDKPISIYQEIEKRIGVNS
jgi:phosphoribosylaminoimidazole-succinocarboxamide synthase